MIPRVSFTEIQVNDLTSSVSATERRLWERLNNPDFKPIDFERFRSESGSNYFVLSPQKWIENTGAIRNHPQH
jgi:hypothetical protein